MSNSPTLILMSSTVRACSVARTLDLVGAKWTLLAVREMLLGNHRFDDIVRSTGAPRDILTTRLRTLEAEGLVTRVQYQEHPPRFEYHLSELGLSLSPIVATMREFGDRHLAGPSGPPMVFRHSCGGEFHAAVACRSCGELVHQGEVVPAEHGSAR